MNFQDQNFSKGNNYKRGRGRPNRTWRGRGGRSRGRGWIPKNQYNQPKHSFSGQRKYPINNTYNYDNDYTTPSARLPNFDYSNQNVQTSYFNKQEDLLRPKSPFPGSEEYTQRNIEKASDFIKKKLQMDESVNEETYSDAVCLDDNRHQKFSEYSEPNKKHYSSEKKSNSNDNKSNDTLYSPRNSNRNCSQKQKPQQTYDVSEIHNKLINHISNLSHARKVNIINQVGPTGYDVAVQEIQKQTRIELSQALREMCKEKCFKENTETLNSIIPDFDIPIENLPKEIIAKLSSSLDVDFEENDFQQPGISGLSFDNYIDFSRDDLPDPIVPETYFRQAEDLLKDSLEYVPETIDDISFATDESFQVNSNFNTSLDADLPNFKEYYQPSPQESDVDISQCQDIDTDSVILPNPFPNPDNDGVILPNPFPNPDNDSVILPNPDNDTVMLPNLFPNPDSDSVILPDPFPNPDQNNSNDFSTDVNYFDVNLSAQQDYINSSEDPFAEIQLPENVRNESDYMIEDTFNISLPTEGNIIKDKSVKISKESLQNKEDFNIGNSDAQQQLILPTTNTFGSNEEIITQNNQINQMFDHQEEKYKTEAIPETEQNQNEASANDTVPVTKKDPDKVHFEIAPSKTSLNKRKIQQHSEKFQLIDETSGKEVEKTTNEVNCVKEKNEGKYQSKLEKIEKSECDVSQNDESKNNDKDIDEKLPPETQSQHFENRKNIQRQRKEIPTECIERTSNERSRAKKHSDKYSDKLRKREKESKMSPKVDCPPRVESISELEKQSRNKKSLDLNSSNEKSGIESRKEFEKLKHFHQYNTDTRSDVFNSKTVDNTKDPIEKYLNPCSSSYLKSSKRNERSRKEKYFRNYKQKTKALEDRVIEKIVKGFSPKKIVKPESSQVHYIKLKKREAKEDYKKEQKKRKKKKEFDKNVKNELEKELLETALEEIDNEERYIIKPPPSTSTTTTKPVDQFTIDFSEIDKILESTLANSIDKSNREKQPLTEIGIENSEDLEGSKKIKNKQPESSESTVRSVYEYEKEELDYDCDTHSEVSVAVDKVDSKEDEMVKLWEKRAFQSKNIEDAAEKNVLVNGKLWNTIVDKSIVNKEKGNEGEVTLIEERNINKKDGESALLDTQVPPQTATTEEECNTEETCILPEEWKIFPENVANENNMKNSIIKNEESVNELNTLDKFNKNDLIAVENVSKLEPENVLVSEAETQNITSAPIEDKNADVKKIVEPVDTISAIEENTIQSIAIQDNIILGKEEPIDNDIESTMNVPSEITVREIDQVVEKVENEEKLNESVDEKGNNDARKTKLLVDKEDKLEENIPVEGKSQTVDKKLIIVHHQHIICKGVDQLSRPSSRESNSDSKETLRAVGDRKSSERKTSPKDLEKIKLKSKDHRHSSNSNRTRSNSRESNLDSKERHKAVSDRKSSERKTSSKDRDKIKHKSKDHRHSSNSNRTRSNSRESNLELKEKNKVVSDRKSSERKASSKDREKVKHKSKDHRHSSNSNRSRSNSRAKNIPSSHRSTNLEDVNVKNTSSAVSENVDKVVRKKKIRVRNNHTQTEKFMVQPLQVEEIKKQCSDQSVQCEIINQTVYTMNRDEIDAISSSVPCSITSETSKITQKEAIDKLIEIDKEIDRMLKIRQGLYQVLYYENELKEVTFEMSTKSTEVSTTTNVNENVLPKNSKRAASDVEFEPQLRPTKKRRTKNVSRLNKSQPDLISEKENSPKKNKRTRGKKSVDNSEGVTDRPQPPKGRKQPAKKNTTKQKKAQILNADVENVHNSPFHKSNDNITLSESNVDLLGLNIGEPFTLTEEMENKLEHLIVNDHDFNSSKVAEKIVCNTFDTFEVEEIVESSVIDDIVLMEQFPNTTCLDSEQISVDQICSNTVSEGTVITEENTIEDSSSNAINIEVPLESNLPNQEANLSQETNVKLEDTPQSTLQSIVNSTMTPVETDPKQEKKVSKKRKRGQSLEKNQILKEDATKSSDLIDEIPTENTKSHPITRTMRRRRATQDKEILSSHVVTESAENISTTDQKLEEPTHLEEHEPKNKRKRARMETQNSHLQKEDKELLIVSDDVQLQKEKHSKKRPGRKSSNIDDNIDLYEAIQKTKCIVMVNRLSEKEIDAMTQSSQSQEEHEEEEEDETSQPDQNLLKEKENPEEPITQCELTDSGAQETTEDKVDELSLFTVNYIEKNKPEVSKENSCEDEQLKISKNVKKPPGQNQKSLSKRKTDEKVVKSNTNELSHSEVTEKKEEEKVIAKSLRRNNESSVGNRKINLRPGIPRNKKSTNQRQKSGSLEQKTVEGVAAGEDKSETKLTEDTGSTISNQIPDKNVEEQPIKEKDGNETDQKTSETEAIVATDQTGNALNEILFKEFEGVILVIKIVAGVILAASDKGKMFCYDLSSGNLLYTFNICSVAITSLCILKNKNDEDLIYTGSLDVKLNVYNFVTKEKIKSQNIGEPIQCMEYAWGYIFIGSDRGSIIRYDVEKDKIDSKEKIFELNVLVLRATQEGARRVLLVAARNSPVSVRDAMSGLLMRTMETPFCPTVYTLLLEKNMVFCGTSQHDILVYTFEDGQLIFKHEATKSKGVVCMQIVKNLLFAGCYNGNVYVYNIKTNEHLGTMNGPGGLLLSMEIHNGKIIVGTKSNKFKLWTIPDQYLKVNESVT